MDEFFANKGLSKQSESMFKIVEDYKRTGKARPINHDINAEIERAEDLEFWNKNLLLENDALRHEKIRLEVEVFDKETTLFDLDYQLHELKDRLSNHDALSFKTIDLEKKLAGKEKLIAELTREIDEISDRSIFIVRNKELEEESIRQGRELTDLYQRLDIYKKQSMDLDSLITKNQSLERILGEKEEALSNLSSELARYKKSRTSAHELKPLDITTGLTRGPQHEPSRGGSLTGGTFPKGIDIFIDDIRKIKEEINEIIDETEKEIKLFDEDSDIGHFDISISNLKRVLMGVNGQIEATKGILALLPVVPSIERRYFERLTWALRNPYSNYLEAQIQAFKMLFENDQQRFYKWQDSADTCFAQYEKSLEDIEVLQNQLMEKFGIDTIF